MLRDFRSQGKFNGMIARLIILSRRLLDHSMSNLRIKIMGRHGILGSDEAILSKNEMAAPFGLAMTVMIILSFV
jgi:hypothetical protein